MKRRSLGLGLLAITSASSVALAQPDTTHESDKGGASEETAADAAKSAEPAATTSKVQPAEPPEGPTASPAAAISDTGPGKSVFTWEPFGYLRMQYIVVQNDPNVQFVGRDDGFEIQNARIGVRGTYLDRVRYTISFEGGLEERNAPNTPEGKLRVGMRDAFADVILSSSTLFVRGGFFETWANPTRLVPDTAREFVDQPIESRGVRSTEGWFAKGLMPGRSIGAAMRLEPAQANQVGFEIAVQNGADEFASNNDNDLPALSGAVLLRLADQGFLVAGGRWNPRTEGELPFRQDETDVQGTFGAQVNAGPVRLGAAGIIQHTTFGSTGGPSENAFGAHAQLVFQVSSTSPVFLGYRFGILDPSSLIVSDRVMEHTVGATFAVPSLRMRVQLQGTHVMEQAERQLTNTRVQLAAELAL